jgi:hypothetical protein
LDWFADPINSARTESAITHLRSMADPTLSCSARRA